MPVKLIGIELEGAFDHFDSQDTSFHHDGSVEIDGSQDCYCDCNEDGTCACCEHECEHGSDFQYVGELVSNPLTFDRVHEWLNRNYPLDFNNSCGMHIHLSFKNNLEYAKFCTPKFFHFFKDQIREWAENNGVKSTQFFKRLDNGNTFTKDLFDCKNQLHSLGDRYCILNYCWRKHKTIEIRLSHVWQNKNFAYMYIEKLVDIFNTWLLLQKRSVKIPLVVY
jgi:hypothetical protein